MDFSTEMAPLGSGHLPLYQTVAGCIEGKRSTAAENITIGRFKLPQFLTSLLMRSSAAAGG